MYTYKSTCTNYTLIRDLMFDFDEGDEKKAAIRRKSSENDQKLQEKLMKIRNKYYNNNDTNKNVNDNNDGNTLNKDKNHSNFDTHHDTNSQVNIKEINHHKNKTKSMTWKCGSCSKLGIDKFDHICLHKYLRMYSHIDMYTKRS
jgi:hypothetical protein